MRNGIKILLLLSCVIPASAREESRRDFRKIAALPAGRMIRVEHAFGSLSIRTHAKNEAEIQAAIHCSANTAAEAKTCADQIQIRVEENAAGVSVKTEYPQQNDRRNNNISYGVDYQILVPETAPLEARNRFGAVDLSGLRAPATINNGNGRVTLSGNRGRQRIENSFGDVDVRSADGDVTVINGNGAVSATDVTGALDISNRFGSIRVTNAGRGLNIRSNNGNIEVSNVSGVASITNSFGRVSVQEAKGDVVVQNQNGEVRAIGITGSADLHTSFARIDFSRIGRALVARANNSHVNGDTVGEGAIVETTFGSVDLRNVKGNARVTAGNTGVRLSGVGGEVYAKTSFAGVTIADSSGPVTVESGNGSVAVEMRPGQKCQPLSLHTTFGPIRVTVPSGAGYNVSARTSFGRIRSEGEMMVTGEVSNDTLTGKINGGGCEMRLLDQNGSIDILRAR